MERKKIVRALVITLLVIIVAIVFVTILVLHFKRDSRKIKLVIDNDAGGDDAIAIFLALLYEKHFNGPTLVALTTCNGNTLEDNVSFNNQRILKAAERDDIPIYRGAKSSLVVTPSTNAYYGRDGLGDYVESVPDYAPVQEENAIIRLIELSKIHEGDLVVVTIGTLTNIALAIKVDPNFLSRLAHLYVAAGNINGPTDSGVEFNANMDVEAYHIMAEHATPEKVTVLPFTQTKIYLNITKQWREKTLGGIDNSIVRAMNKYEQVSLANPTDRWQSLDPSAVAMVLKPDLVKEYKYAQNDIILCGENRGINTNKFVEKEEANVRLIYSMKDKEYQRFLIDVFKRGI